jgi:hypothetical protein
MVCVPHRWAGEVDQGDSRWKLDCPISLQRLPILISLKKAAAEEKLSVLPCSS